MRAGIVAEYNPFHNGHLYQIAETGKYDPELVMAVISGDFVQRGEFSFIDKWEKTEIALNNGIDLVIELPLYYSLQNAEVFCREAVKILEYMEADTQIFGAETVWREIEALGVSCLAWMGDAGDFESCSRLFDAIRERFGSLDVLVNNAGISYIGLFQDMTPDEWNHILNTNLTSVFNCCRLAIPMMVSRKSGRILNISSVWGNVGASMEVAYSASKGGVNSFTKALAKELAPSNIQVNAISCGVIDTAMNHCFSPEEMNALREEIPADRLGQPEEVAKLVLQLIQAPTYLTGQILTLDGGWQ